MTVSKHFEDRLRAKVEEIDGEESSLAARIAFAGSDVPADHQAVPKPPLGKQRTVQIEYDAESVITRRVVYRATGTTVATDEVYRHGWFGEHAGKAISAKSSAGWRCAHAVIESDDYEEPRCGWCDSQGDNGEFMPCIVIVCPNCNTVCTDDLTGELSFVRHLTEECGL